MQTQWISGYILTGLGIIGIFASFVIQKSEYDPTAFSISIMSIFMAIAGIALVLQPAKEERSRKRHGAKTS